MKVAVVTAGGRLHAIRPGSVVLTASCEGITESVKLTVGGTGAVAPIGAGATAASPPATRVVTWRRRRHRIRPLLAGALLVGVAGGLAWLFGRPDSSTVSAALPDTPPVVEDSAPADAGESAAPLAVVITKRPTRSLRPAGAFQLLAQVRTGDGRVIGDEPVTWASTDSTVLRIHPSGWVKALRPGQVFVVASRGSSRDSAPVRVRLPRVQAPVIAAVSVAPVRPLHVGDSVTVHAAVLEAGGDTVEDAVVTWHSSDASVVAVDESTGRVIGRAPGTAVLIARSGDQSALAELSVLPAPVAQVILHGGRPLVVGETVTLLGIPTDADGRALSGRELIWMSSDTTVLSIDALTGVAMARTPGTATVTGTSEGATGFTSITVSARRDPPPGPAGETGIRAGVDECYAAIEAKDVDRMARLYRPVTKSDEDNLKKLRRILRTREWGAFVGARVDGERLIGNTSAAMEFTFRLTWKDAFGGRLSSEPTFRAEFTKRGGRWTITSCRIVGSPNL